MRSLPEPTPRVLFVNGALNGSAGSTAVMLAHARAALAGRATCHEIVLAAGASYATARLELERADAFLFGTGTHWDSWSHLLQQFLEDATPDEGTSLWLGKPAGVIVTMHSVGGKGVLSRLQGVLNTMGCVIPPMSGLVYSAVNQAALGQDLPTADDIWSPDDVEILCHNLLAGMSGAPYRAWACDRRYFGQRWISS